MNTVLTIIIALLLFSLIIFLHEFGHFITAKLFKIKVNEFAIGMGPKLIAFGKGETRYSLRLLPIGGYVSMEGEDEMSEDPRSFSKAAVWKRILIVVAGAVMNLILGFLVLCLAVGCDEVITSRTVSSFYENASTKATGLEVGDTILSVNGRKCYIANDILYEFARIDSGTAEMVVLRNGEKVTLPAVTFQTEENEEGLNQIVIDFTVLPIEKTFGTLVKEAFHWSISYARLIFLSLVDLITGRVAINNLSGPVGIVSTIASAVSYGIQPLLLLMALITINLGVFNLLPLPALDGGKLLLLVLEAIRRKPIPEKYEIVINTAGFILLMLLMAFVTFNDITRLVTG